MLSAAPLKCLWVSWVAIGVLSTIGCGHKGPPRAPVVGTIRYQGRPVIGAAVTFVPVEAKFRMASGVTDEQGSYRLETLGYGDGAILGQHRVCIVLREAVPEVSKDASPLQNLASRPIGKSLLPRKYADPEKSGLTADVGDGSENRFDFDLKESS